MEKEIRIYIRPTPDEHKTLSLAAEKEKRSIPSFLLYHSLIAARDVLKDASWADFAGGGGK